MWHVIWTCVTRELFGMLTVTTYLEACVLSISHLKGKTNLPLFMHYSRVGGASECTYMYTHRYYRLHKYILGT